MKIAILGAMEQEITLLKASLEDMRTEQYCHMEFYLGKLNGVDVVLTRCGIGKVASAVGAAIVIEQFKPDYVVNTGSAGGFDTSLNVGDVVVANEVQHHDVDLTSFDYEYGQCSGMPTTFKCDTNLVEAATQAANKNDQVQNIEGLVCTGDSFVCKDETVAHLRSLLPNMAACEMEGAAIGQTCHMLEVPFLVIRSLSDIAGKTSTVSFYSYLEKAATNSAHLVMDMIAELAKK